MDRALSPACYHGKHDACSGPAHCGCPCHAESEMTAGPTPTEVAFMESKIASLEGQVAYLQERILEELARAVEMQGKILKLETRLAGYEQIGR